MSSRPPRRRGPKPKAESYSRLELYWPNDTMLVELRAEAERRGVTVQSHIRDLLVARHLARQGDSLARLLWIPEADPQQPSDMPAPDSPEEPPPSAAAQAFKAALLDLDDDDAED